MKLKDMVDFILGGGADKDLDAITDAVKTRRAALARLELRAIDVGDTIRFKDSIHPTYLRGLTAVVTKVNPSSVVVTIENNPKYGRFSGSRGVRCPASLIERLSV